MSFCVSVQSNASLNRIYMSKLTFHYESQFNLWFANCKEKSNLKGNIFTPSIPLLRVKIRLNFLYLDNFSTDSVFDNWWPKNLRVQMFQNTTTCLLLSAMGL